MQMVIIQWMILKYGCGSITKVRFPLFSFCSVLSASHFFSSCLSSGWFQTKAKELKVELSEYVADVVRQIDLDGSGEISKEEMIKCKPAHQEEKGRVRRSDGE